MRSLLVSAVFLTLGAVLNAAVAIACARWGQVPAAGTAQIDVGSIPSDAANYLSESKDPGVVSKLLRTESRSLGCTRVVYTRADIEHNFEYRRTHESFRFGLPLAAMEYQEQGTDPVSLHADGTWRVEGWRGGWPLAPSRWKQNSYSQYSVPRPQHIYPLLPVPLGFAINTLFYGTVCFVLFRGVEKIRQRRLARQGRCSRCGYPTVRGTPVCCECGHILPHASGMA